MVVVSLIITLLRQPYPSTAENHQPFVPLQRLRNPSREPHSQYLRSSHRESPVFRNRRSRLWNKASSTIRRCRKLKSRTPMIPTARARRRSAHIRASITLPPPTGSVVPARDPSLDYSGVADSSRRGARTDDLSIRVRQRPDPIVDRFSFLHSLREGDGAVKRIEDILLGLPSASDDPS